MRLLVADSLHLAPLEELEILGVEINYRPEIGTAELPDALKGADILVVRSTKVTSEVIEKCPNLNLIIRAGAGVNTIDVAAASRHGCYVANCPGKNAAAVAELAMAHMLAVDRRIVDATAALRSGRWEKTEYQEARGVYGQRLGVAGLGSIGRLVALRALAFGMKVRGWSRSLTHNKANALGIKRRKTLLELAADSDILTLHLPLTPQTRGIVDREVLEALPDGATFINTSRAEIVDEDALAEVAANKGLRLGLDVFADEPKSGAADYHAALLAKLDGKALVYGTPHIGASTEQAQRAVAVEVARIVRAFLTEEEVPNVVNVCRNTPARYALVLRSRDEVGVLANVLNVIKRHGLNIEEIVNTVFDGAHAACTKLRLSGRPGEDCLSEIRAFDEVFHVDVVALPNLA